MTSGVLFDERLQLLDRFAVGGDARKPEQDRVPLEDLRERLADDGANAVTHQPLRRVLARRSAAEVPVDDQHRGARVTRIAERMLRVGFAVVFEEMLLEPVERDHPKIPGRHDPIGVDVVAAKRDGAAAHDRR